MKQMAPALESATRPLKGCNGDAWNPSLSPPQQQQQASAPRLTLSSDLNLTIDGESHDAPWGQKINQRAAAARHTWNNGMVEKRGVGAFKVLY